MKIRIIYFVIPVVIGLAASLTGFSLLWRLFVVSLLLPLIGFLWTYFALRGLNLDIGALPPVSQAGKTIETNITLHNPRSTPRLMLEVEEQTDIPGYWNRRIANLMPKRQLLLSSEIRLQRRGVYHCGVYRISAGDPLGLFRAERFFGQGRQIMVYPGSQDLPFFDPLHYLSAGFGPGRYVSLQHSNNVASIRDYISGDSLRHIHWRTTAHSSRLMVKVYEPDRSQNSAKNIWVVADMQAAAQAGLGVQSTEEYTVNIAASITRKYIEQGWPVGLLARAEKPYYFTLESGSAHLENIYAGLAVMRAAGEQPLEQLLVSESGHFNLNSMTVVITPACHERLFRALMQLKRQQGIVVAVFLDAATFGGPKMTPGTAVNLQANGIQVYIVRNGDNPDEVLDSRKL